MDCKHTIILSLDAGLKESLLEENKNGVAYLDQRYNGRELISTISNEKTDTLLVQLNGKLSPEEAIQEYPITPEQLSQIADFGKDSDNLGMVIIGHHSEGFGFNAGDTNRFSGKVLAELVNKFVERGVNPRKMNITACALDKPEGELREFLQHVQWRPTGGPKELPYGLKVYDQIVSINAQGKRLNNHSRIYAYSFETNEWEEVNIHVYTDRRNKKKKLEDNEAIIKRELKKASQFPKVNIKLNEPMEGVLSATVGYAGINVYVRDNETYNDDHWETQYKISEDAFEEIGVRNLKVGEQLAILVSNGTVTVQRPQQELHSDALLESLKTQREVLQRQALELEQLKGLPVTKTAQQIKKDGITGQEKSLEAEIEKERVLKFKEIEKDLKRVNRFLKRHSDEPNRPLTDLQGHTYMQRIAQFQNHLNEDRQLAIANLYLRKSQVSETENFRTLLNKSDELSYKYDALPKKERSPEIKRELKDLRTQIKNRNKHLHFILTDAKQYVPCSLNDPRLKERQEWQEKELKTVRESYELLNSSFEKITAQIKLESLGKLLTEAESLLKDQLDLQEDLATLRKNIDFESKFGELYKDVDMMRMVTSAETLLKTPQENLIKPNIISLLRPLLRGIEDQVREPDALRLRRERIQLDLKQEKKLVNNKLQALANANLAEPELKTLHQSLTTHQKKIDVYLKTAQERQQPAVLNDIEEYLYQQRITSTLQTMRLKGESSMSSPMPEERQAHVIKALNHVVQTLSAQIRYLQTKLPLLQSNTDKDLTNLAAKLQQAHDLFDGCRERSLKEVLDETTLNSVEQLLKQYDKTQKSYAEKIRDLSGEEQLVLKRQQMNVALQAASGNLSNDILTLNTLISDSPLLQRACQDKVNQWQTQRDGINHETTKLLSATDRDLVRMQSLVDAEQSQRIHRQALIRNIRNTKNWYLPFGGGGDDHPPGPPPDDDHGRGGSDSKKESKLSKFEGGKKFGRRMANIIKWKGSTNSDGNKSKTGIDGDVLVNMISLAGCLTNDLHHDDLAKLDKYDARPVAIGDKLGNVAEVLGNGKSYIVQLMLPDRYSQSGQGVAHVIVPAALYLSTGRINEHDTPEIQIKKVKGSSGFSVQKDAYIAMLERINSNKPAQELEKSLDHNSGRKYRS